MKYSGYGRSGFVETALLVRHAKNLMLKYLVTDLHITRYKNNQNEILDVTEHYLQTLCFCGLHSGENLILCRIGKKHADRITAYILMQKST